MLISPSKFYISASSTSESTLIFLLSVILFDCLRNLPYKSMLILLAVFNASFGLVLLFFDLSVRPPKGVRSTLPSLLVPKAIVDVLFILSVLCPGLKSLFLMVVL